MHIDKIVRKVAYILLGPAIWFLKRFFPKGDVIILQTYKPEIYCENTKYLFEYLTENSDYKVFWVTENKEIQDYLSGKNYHYISNRRPFHKIYVTLKAKIIIDSGMSYYNFLNLIRRKTIKITTTHGNGPKHTLVTYKDVKETFKYIFQLCEFDFINFTSHYSKIMVGSNNFKIPPHKLISLGYPRCDQYFKKDFVEARYKTKGITYDLCPGFNTDGKVILYTPTWRHYSFDFPLLYLDGFDLEDFNHFLADNNLFFFFTTHSSSAFDSELANKSNFIQITHHGRPFFDINRFMLEVDILVNDYSTTTTDFALLSRPQIFFMPDYEYFFENKGFIEDYRAVLPGKEVFSINDFTDAIQFFVNNPGSYVATYGESLNLLLERYYDRSITNSCGLFKEFIDRLMEKGLNANNDRKQSKLPPFQHS